MIGNGREEVSGTEEKGGEGQEGRGGRGGAGRKDPLDLLSQKNFLPMPLLTRELYTIRPIYSILLLSIAVVSEGLDRCHIHVTISSVTGTNKNATSFISIEPHRV